MDFITKFQKKNQSGNLVYLVCSKRGKNSQNCKGKAKYYIKTGVLQIYEKCKNDRDLHTTLTFETFYDLYQTNIFENINMYLRLNQKYYVKCLLKNNDVITYIRAKENFNIRFNNLIIKLINPKYKTIDKKL